ncbi:MAG: hypothetical protein ACTHYV_06690 [Psychroflexus sp.]
MLSLLVGCTPSEPKTSEEEFEDFMEATRRRKEREAEKEKAKQLLDGFDALIELEEKGY